MSIQLYLVLLSFVYFTQCESTITQYNDLSTPSEPSSVAAEGTGVSSVGTDVTSSMISASAVTNVSVTYRYRIRTNFALYVGIINNRPVIDSLKHLIERSFNLTNIAESITITKIEVQFTSRISNDYNLLIDILFTISSGCDRTCINQRARPTNTTIALLLRNGTVISELHSLTPSLVSGTTTTTVVYLIGGSSPGIPAQLGMGLGISFIGVLLIAEVAFLYWKYELSNNSHRQVYGTSLYR